jgi:hypothetical protein
MFKNSNSLNLCIFANFFIDNEERLQRMKDSFNSFRDSNPNEWRINIRGRLKQEAGNYLLKELGGRLNLNYIETKKGWFHDSFFFMKDVKSDFILFWIEDHLCLANPTSFKDVLLEMREYNVDVLLYSWFHHRIHNQFKMFSKVADGEHVQVARIDKTSSSYFSNKQSRNFYVVSAQSIFKKDFFFTVLLSNRPYLKRWPKHLPFNFEKKIKDRVSNVIRYAIPKYELFALIDEGIDIPGYSLISRGKYPNRLTREELKKIEFNFKTSRLKIILKKFLPKFIFLSLSKVNSILKRIVHTLNYMT